MAIMWQCMKDLPAEIVGNHVFAFLEVRDIVRMERAVVTMRELDALYVIVRSGPALYLAPKLSNHAAYAWLCKRNLRMRSVFWRAGLENQYADLHTRVETVEIIKFDPKTPFELPADELLRNKVSYLVMHGSWSFSDPTSAPGKYLHELKSLWVTGESCTADWMLELLQANTALQTLFITLRDLQLPANWFADAAGFCRNLQELELYGVGMDTGDSALRCIAANCLLLRKLCLYYSSSATNSETGETPMITVAQRCKWLQHLEITARKLSSATVTTICLHCRNLTALLLPFASVSLNDLLHLLPQDRKQPVTELACRWALQQESEVQACATVFSGLKVLRVTIPEQCKHSLASAILHLADVRRLTITAAAQLSVPATAEVLSAVAKSCRRLRQFTLSGSSVDASVIIPVLAANRFLNTCSIDITANETLLRTLAEHCPLLGNINVSGITDDTALSVTTGCKHLFSVHIEHSDITDATLIALGTHCLKLQYAEIRHCPLVTEAGFTQLAATSPRLYYLEIKHPAIDSAAAARIRGACARDLCVSWR
jgi:hypothetical protein